MLISNQTQKTTEANFLLPTSDGSMHFLRQWKAPQAKAVLVYLHGIVSHGLWFAPTASELADKGITSYTIDRRGAGCSGGKRGQINSWKTFIYDIKELIEQIKQKELGLPIFLMANCWGAKVATTLIAYDKSFQNNLAGLILTSPAIVSKIDLSLTQKAHVLLNFLLGNPTPLPIPLSPQHFTNNPKYLHFIEDDSARLTTASANFFIASFFLSLLSKKSAPLLQLPILILQANQDSIVNIDALKQWYSAIASPDKQLHILPNTYHSLDFDTDPQEYWDILSHWLLNTLNTINGQRK